MTAEPLKAPSGGFKAWSTKKKLLVALGILAAIIALAVGLGVGLGIGLNKDDDSDSDSDDSDHLPPGHSTPAKWQPAVGTTWQIELLHPLKDTSVDADVYDIDLFTNPKSTIDELHDQGRKVICYFSAGSYENWRPDKGDFAAKDLGAVMDGWPDEKWVNVSGKSVRDVMSKRLDMAAEKGCDGVDPDNVDGYDNKNGVGLTKAQAADFVNWLADEAHARGMSVGLKNAAAIIPAVIDNMQWSVNEQCAQYDECDTYAAFVENDKPVFHIEYPKGDTTNNNVRVSQTKVDEACDFQDSGNFSTVIKNMNLDDWIQRC
ncbi:putative endo alpha-1,4 polygalactosaminidase [Aspergillus taichungensis]|uniref:alpha-galactosidase n=1 Tax=Aspergillus taichungensis TaxID=482145 RepID=A0A2J5HXU4_9EURO|nr:putative endo alpha-1,4 polygalactosaminidase [Aspergillus taichungensis]